MVTFGVLCLCSFLQPLVSVFLTLVTWSLFRRSQVDRSTKPYYLHFLCFLSTQFRVLAWSFEAICILLQVFCIFHGSRRFTGSFDSSCHRLGSAFIRTLWPCWSIYSVPIVLGSHLRMFLGRSIPVLLENNHFLAFHCLFSAIWFSSHFQASVFLNFFRTLSAKLASKPPCSRFLCFCSPPNSSKPWPLPLILSCTF